MPTSSLLPRHASFDDHVNELQADPLASFTGGSNMDLNNVYNHNFQQPRSSSTALLDGDSRAMQLAMELAMLQGTTSTASSSLDLSTSNGTMNHHHHPQHHPSLSASASYDPNPLLFPSEGLVGLNHHNSLDDLKHQQQRRSQNMTECVPVPTSEHVAEIVGRQGCKIKALRAKTNTYIKTPVRGEEPVFVVTGRKEDVALAKREILSAADHFSQIRASRSKNSGINSTLAFGQLVANQPGQTTTQVRVPYRVVGLVVGPKGATIKRIQQQTHTYIVTPSRDKEPVFEVTGLPENVEAARKEIEAHIALRTGADSSLNNIYGIGDNDSGNGGFGVNGFSSTFSSSNGHLDHIGSSSSSSKFSQFMSNANGSSTLETAFSSLSSSSAGMIDSSKGITLQSLLDSDTSSLGLKLGLGGSSSRGPSMTAWSNGESHDSGIGNSPPFDLKQQFQGAAMSSIWNDLNKVLGSLDLNGSASSTIKENGSGCPVSETDSSFQKSFLNVGSRSSLDLGCLGRPSLNLTSIISSSAQQHYPNGTFGSNASSHHETSSTTSSNHTATPPNALLLSSGDASPPNSLPFQININNTANGPSLLSNHRGSLPNEKSGPFLTESKVEETAALDLAAFVLKDSNSANDTIIGNGNINKSETNEEASLVEAGNNKSGTDNA